MKPDHLVAERQRDHGMTSFMVERDHGVEGIAQHGEREQVLRPYQIGLSIPCSGPGPITNQLRSPNGASSLYGSVGD